MESIPSRGGYPTAPEMFRASEVQFCSLPFQLSKTVNLIYHTLQVEN